VKGKEAKLETGVMEDKRISVCLDKTLKGKFHAGNKRRNVEVT